MIRVLGIDLLGSAKELVKSSAAIQTKNWKVLLCHRKKNTITKNMLNVPDGTSICVACSMSANRETPQTFSQGYVKVFSKFAENILTLKLMQCYFGVSLSSKSSVSVIMVTLLPEHLSNTMLKNCFIIILLFYIRVMDAHCKHTIQP